MQKWCGSSLYVSKYVSEIVKTSFQKNLLTLEDLYTKKETELVGIFEKNFTSWKNFFSTKPLFAYSHFGMVGI